MQRQTHILRSTDGGFAALPALPLSQLNGFSMCLFRGPADALGHKEQPREVFGVTNGKRNVVSAWVTCSEKDIDHPKAIHNTLRT